VTLNSHSNVLIFNIYKIYSINDINKTLTNRMSVQNYSRSFKVIFGKKRKF